MKDQADPITDDEWILRRVHFDKFVSLDPPRINPYAFKPQVTGRSPDNTGISFYRQACVVVHHDILVKTDVAKCQKYGIVRVPIAFFSSLELHVHRDDDVEPPIILGHVVLPGINSENYVADKDGVMPLMKRLADYVNEHQTFLLLPSG